MAGNKDRVQGREGALGTQKENQTQVRVPVQERSRETRERIIRAGRELFGRKGYRETSVKEVARRAGTATGSVYAYFPDKPSLFLEITDIYYREVFDCIRGEMEEIFPAGQKQQGRQEPPEPPDLRDPRDLRPMIASLLRTLSRAHNIQPDLHREISLMLLASTHREGSDGSGGAAGSGGAEAELCREVRARVNRLDAEVEAWVKGLIGRFRPGLDADLAAPLLFRVCEETVHRLKQFPETMPPEEQALEELGRLVAGYLAGG